SAIRADRRRASMNESSVVSGAAPQYLTVTGMEEKLLASIDRGVLLRVEAAAVLLGIGRTKMYELIRSCQIPVIRIGRRTRIHRADLEQFAEGQRWASSMVCLG